MRRSNGSSSGRRPQAAATAALLLLAASAGAATASSTGGGGGGMMVAPILKQARRPLPPHKLRMLFGEDPHAYRRFLEGSAPAGAGAVEGDLPLHAGYGTHYAFMYVGTPAQRVSVILDTGSHWTAFPCTGCRQCGDDHTDPVFDVAKSTSYHALDCAECQFAGHCKDSKCSISLSYAEGSRWDAYEVKDNVYLGGDDFEAPTRGGAGLSMPFVFGCQTYETGLFRTQLENGIMGLSFQDLTIVPKLKENGKIKERVFSLCFTEEGGAMRLGGYETAHHSKPLAWVPMTKPTGWYTVTLHDIKIGATSIAVDPSAFNTGQGTIVDSGTTDTYLPRSIQMAFTAAFKKATGVEYSSRLMSLTQEQFKALPPITFVLDGGVEVGMPWENYIECADGQCAGAIFLDNGNGAVLGANFMRGNDVVFDLERQKVGFAPANCDYVAPAAGAAAPPAAGAAAVAGAAATTNEEDKDCELAFGEEAGPCDAECPAGEDGVAAGEQPFNMAVKAPAKGKGKPCPALPLVEKKPCLVTCHAAAGEGGEPCPAEVAWGPCTAACEQKGQAQAKQADGSCGPVAVTRPCAVGAECAAALEGYAVDVLLLLIGVGTGSNKDRTLSRALQDVLLAQVSALLDVPPGNVEIVPPLDADVQAARKAQPPEEEKDGTPLALRLHLGAGADKEAKAAEVSAAVQAPAFADALMGKLKAAPGGGFAALSAVAAGPSKVAAMAGGVTVGATAEGGVVGVGGGGGAQEAAPVEDARDLSVFLWDIVGGGAALFAVLMLLVHFRWAHWQRLAVAQQQEGGGAAHAGQQGPTAAGTAAAAAAASSAAILGRIRQGTESIGSVSGLKRGTGSSSNVKPDTRSYELVEAGKGGGAHLVGGEDEAEEEDIEMI